MNKSLLCRTHVNLEYLMSSTKETPKKIYNASTNFESFACRLCLSVGDSGHRKKLFSPSSVPILKECESLYGKPFAREENLPHLICRPCERRVKNILQFKTVIQESQRKIEGKTRVKRCVAVSPSVPKPASKSRSSGTATRSLDFTPDNNVQAKERPSASRIFRNSGLGRKESISVNEEKYVSTGTLLERINDEIATVCRPHDPSAIDALFRVPSVFQRKRFNELESLSWLEILEELSCKCPLTLDVLSALLDGEHKTESKLPVLCLIYSLVTFARNPKMGRLQHINSMVLTEGHASTKLMERLNKYGICLSPVRKYALMEEIGKHHLDKAVELVKNGETFVLVVDNIDWEVRAHDVRQSHQNRSVHAVAASLVFDRVSSSHLPSITPQQDFAVLNNDNLVFPTLDEIAETRSRNKFLVARIITEYLTEFQFFKQFIPEHLPHQYENEMKSKSTIITLPVMMKDEKSYADCVDILDQLETWVEEIILRARGEECAIQVQGRGPAIVAPARPDQPAAHVPPVPDPNDPLAGVQVPLFGDQLTRVRVSGAKDLRAGAHTPKHRLEHLYPFRIVHWHTKASYLKLTFKNLYLNSTREQGTLRYFRDKLNRRKVCHRIKHYEDCEQLFVSVGKMHVVQAAMTFYGMNKRTDHPTKNILPMVFLQTKQQQELYFEDTLNKFLDEYIDREDDANEDNSEDRVQSYAIHLMKRFLLFEDLRDAVKEGNGERLSSLCKYLLLHFKSHSSFNAYAIEMLVSIVQNEVLLSERQAHQVKWASTTNWKGGAGRNIEIDLMQEKSNMFQKNLIKSMGANKTDKAIHRASRSSSGIKGIVENLDSLIGVAQGSSDHKHRSSFEDELKILEDLQNLKPFITHAGRVHRSFRSIHKDPLHNVNEVELNNWLHRHKNNILMGFQGDLDSDNSSSE